MCTLAHYFEKAGIATVVIGLVRMHAEIIRPPRTLFVPFELGRPLGSPNEPSAQREVLLAALRLLELSGPSPILVDYPDLREKSANLPWNPHFNLPSVLQSTIDAAALVREFAAIRPVYERGKADRGRTTFGNSGLEPDAMVQLLCGLLGDSPLAGKEISSKVVRFAVDDLKTIYCEAATWSEPSLSSWQVGDWFWRRTIAGHVIIALRNKYSDSGNKGLQLVSSRFFIPGEWLDELGL